MRNTNKIRVTQGQSLLDVAIQHAGAPEAAFNFAAVNDLSITDTPETGDLLEKVSALNKRVFNYFSNNALKPATAITASASGASGGFGEPEEGVEFWFVEYDFAVG